MRYVDCTGEELSVGDAVIGNTDGVETEGTIVKFLDNNIAEVMRGEGDKTVEMNCSDLFKLPS